MTHEHKSDIQAVPSIYDGMKDRLRSAERLIDLQIKAFDSMGRLSALFASLCLVIMGYLFSYDISNMILWMKIPLLLIFTILALSAWFSTSVWEISPMDKFKTPARQTPILNGLEMVEALGDAYLDMSQKAQENLCKKITKLNNSLRIGKVGIASAFLWVIVDFCIKSF